MKELLVGAGLTVALVVILWKAAARRHQERYTVDQKVLDRINQGDDAKKRVRDLVETRPSSSPSSTPSVIDGPPADYTKAYPRS